MIGQCNAYTCMEIGVQNNLRHFASLEEREWMLFPTRWRVCLGKRESDMIRECNARLLYLSGLVFGRSILIGTRYAAPKFC